MATLKDRLIFDKHVLPNGITLYHYGMDVPFASIAGFFPLGHVHNRVSFPQGAAHFLEHMVCRKSARYPIVDSFDKTIARDGGRVTACTDLTDTSHIVRIPEESFQLGLNGILSRIYEPIFDQSGIEHERDVVSSERRMQSKWHPGDDEIQHYIATCWMDFELTTLRQDLGEDTDLEQITLPVLYKAHEAYLDPQSYFITGGACDTDLILRRLASIPTKPNERRTHVRPITFVRREYHERGFEDEHRFTYRLGGMYPGDLKSHLAMNFLHGLLVGSVDGVLHEWLRNQLGWSYELGLFSKLQGPQGVPGIWILRAPVRTAQQAEIVRHEIRGRVEAALCNRELIASEVRRMILGSVFSLQKLGDWLTFAHQNLSKFGMIPSEEMLNDIFHSFEDGVYLRELYEEWWAPEKTAELLTMPLR